MLQLNNTLPNQEGYIPPGQGGYTLPDRRFLTREGKTPLTTHFQWRREGKPAHLAGTYIRFSSQFLVKPAIGTQNHYPIRHKCGWSSGSTNPGSTRSEEVKVLAIPHTRRRTCQTQYTICTANVEVEYVEPLATSTRSGFPEKCICQSSFSTNSRFLRDPHLSNEQLNEITTELITISSQSLS